MSLPAPYYDDGKGIVLYCGDCREIAPLLPWCDVSIADPPYGETSLEWDRRVEGWPSLVSTDSLWCFGSLRMFMETLSDFTGWSLAQDIVWRKHNGSNFHADRFKRIHEIVAQFYRGKWSDIYKSPVTTNDATARVVRNKTRPTHTGHIESTPYQSVDGGPRLQRSVIDVRSCHGYAVHPTQKPLGIILPLIEYSCPDGGSVVDPFAGSGSVLVAAKKLGRRAFGVEINPDNCERAVQRLRQGVLSFGESA